MSQCFVWVQFAILYLTIGAWLAASTDSSPLEYDPATVQSFEQFILAHVQIADLGPEDWYDPVADMLIDYRLNAADDENNDGNGGDDDPGGSNGNPGQGGDSQGGQGNQGGGQGNQDGGNQGGNQGGSQNGNQSGNQGNIGNNGNNGGTGNNDDNQGNNGNNGGNQGNNGNDGNNGNNGGKDDQQPSNNPSDTYRDVHSGRYEPKDSELPVASDPPADISLEPFEFSLLQQSVLDENKEHLHDYDSGLQHALWYLTKSSRRFYNDNSTVMTVVTNNKTGVRSPHDYISLARYFWPNPNTPDGKPYERQDGLVNPEIHSIPDYWLLHLLTKEVHFLSLSYHYFNNETYAQKGVDLLRQWFVQPELRMNPHMCYGSLIKGRSSGRSQGIMDFSHMPEMLDAIVLLQKSSVWTKEMTAHIRHWFTTYQNWLLTSRFGEAECQAKNNHGTYYDLQRLSLHLFLKQTDKAYGVLESVKERLKSQISANGEQPHETMRPFSWFYSIYNLRAFFQLCRMSQHLTDRSTGQPIDMCQYTRDGETKPAIRLALDYLVPFALNESTWPHNNTGGFDGSKHLVDILEDAYIHYGDSYYMQVYHDVADRHAHRYNISRLTRPWSVLGDHSPQATQGFGSFSDSGSSLFLYSYPTVAMVTFAALLCTHLLIKS